MERKTDPVRQLIRATLAERQLNMSSVSKKLGKNHAYLHQFLDRGIPGQLPELIREKLATILQVPEAQLKGTGAAVSGAASERTLRGSMPFVGDRIPVLATGEGGEDRFPWTGEIVDYVARPPHLGGATQAYAVYIVGSTMEPRYQFGEIVYVHPGKPIAPGAFVLVQTTPGQQGEMAQAFIKRFTKRTATKLTFEQYNPPKQTEVKVSDIATMHRIVGSAESGGA